MNALLVLAIIVAAILLTVIAVAVTYFNLWLQAKASGIQVSILEMAMMRLRRISSRQVVKSLITMNKAGLDVSLDDVESHILAGGSLAAVSGAAIRVQKADLDMDFRQLAAIDLAGRDVVDAIETSVNPKVLVCPSPAHGAGVVNGVCQDGVRVSASARVTVRTRLDRLVGGAGKDTVVARVGEGIVAGIGRAASHQDVLGHPQSISEYILDRGLDSGTCFEIVSVDIADVSVEDNVGARLKSDQAEADKFMAQARAEVRRAAAVAAHTEMQARTRQMQSNVEQARRVLPTAEAGAFHAGNLGRRKSLPLTFNSRLKWKTAESAR
ncbi:MAG: flotillin-like FloA family protein [Lentisphaeria bacterium]